MSSCLHCHIELKDQKKFCCHSCELLYGWLQQGKIPFLKKIDDEKPWAIFSRSEIEADYNLSESSESKSFRIHLQGLQCSSCVHLLEYIPEFYPDLTGVRIDYGQSMAVVTTNTTVNLGEVCSVFAALGYEPTPIKQGESHTQLQYVEARRELRRIGLTAALAGNILLFAVPLYGGLTGELAEIFKIIQLILFIPILIYSARPFYRGIVNAIAFKKLSVDLMIAFALWSGFTLSCISLYHGMDDLYFDSTASFIFLILSVRFYLKKHQQKFFSQDLLSQIFSKELYTVSDAGRKTQKTHEQVGINQRLWIKKSQYVPVDGYLNSVEASVDMSYLTGESEPQLLHSGDAIRAGTRLLSEFAEMVCLKPTKQSDLARSLEKIRLGQSKSLRYQSLADQVSHWLTLAVFSLAAVFFLLSWSDLGYDAFKRSLALITIACPCAVAFGTPLAQHMGLLKAFRLGYLVRDETVFEKLSQIQKIFFDKTGTLTSNQLDLVRTFPNNISKKYQQIILGLEKNSLHPVAMGFKKAWSHEAVIPLNVREVVGSGRVAEFNGFEYRIEKSAEKESVNGSSEPMRVDFLINGQVAAYFYFQEKLKPESKEVIDQLYRKGYDIFMLSGDRRSAALDVSRKLGIRPQNVYSEQTVDSKTDIVSQHGPSLFVGDGLNDLRALQAAAVGYAIRGPFEATMQVSDIYAPGKDLEALPQVIQLGRQVQRVVQANILFSIFYNSIGGLLALGGFINPLVAAVLMPVSSFIISAHTVWRLR